MNSLRQSGKDFDNKLVELAERLLIGLDADVESIRSPLPNGARVVEVHESARACCRFRLCWSYQWQVNATTPARILKSR